ncbi:MAG: hypothetical protein ACREN7_00665 [Candidatus Dormibacteria bacterium]
MADVERFRLHRRGGGATVAVSAWPLRIEGDTDLCRLVQAQLDQPLVDMRESLDATTGERGTRLVRIGRDNPDWLVSCLRRAAHDLDLNLEDVPLRQS